MSMPYSLQKEVIDTIEWYYVMDEETDRVLYASPALIKQCGPRLMEQPCREVLADSPLLRIFQAAIPPEGSLEWELAIGEQNSYLLIRNRRIWHDGHRCRVGVVIHASDIIGVSRDMSQLIVDYQQAVDRNKQLLNELNWNAYHDQLTCLYNRNKYMTDCEQLFSSQSGYGVMSLDINNLKWVNDHYGHEQGDCLIRTVGKALQTVEEDGRTYCYRVGGDEFVLVSLCSSEHELRAVRDRICAYIASESASYKKTPMAGAPDADTVMAGSPDADTAMAGSPGAVPAAPPAFEVAAGYAVAGPGMDFKTVFRLADDRMYMQKRMLKNADSHWAREKTCEKEDV